MTRITENFDEPVDLALPTAGHPTVFDRKAKFSALQVEPQAGARDYGYVDNQAVKGYVISLTTHEGGAEVTRFVFDAAAVVVKFRLRMTAPEFDNPQFTIVTYKDEASAIIGTEYIPAVKDKDFNRLVESNPSWTRKVKSVEIKTGSGGTQFVTAFTMET